MIVKIYLNGEFIEVPLIKYDVICFGLILY